MKRSSRVFECGVPDYWLPRSDDQSGHLLGHCLGAVICNLLRQLKRVSVLELPRLRPCADNVCGVVQMRRTGNLAEISRGFLHQLGSGRANGIGPRQRLFLYHPQPKPKLQSPAGGLVPISARQLCCVQRAV